jgi:hypothetical protein
MLSSIPAISSQARMLITRSDLVCDNVGDVRNPLSAQRGAALSLFFLRSVSFIRLLLFY